MAVLHEPGHTYLHPPGGGEFANTEHLDEDEERLVHNAAAKACDGIGLEGYGNVTIAYGVPRHLLAPVTADRRGLADEIATFLESVGREYERPPALPTRS